MEGVLGMEYSVGDIVVCTGRYDKLDIDGRVGKIVGFRDDKVLVEFNERFSSLLHKGNGTVQGKRNSCWFVPLDRISKIGIYNEDSYTYNIDLEVFNQLIT